MSAKTERWLLIALAVVIWAGPMRIAFYADHVISDLPRYQLIFDQIADGNVPYRDFTVEYPPLATGLFGLTGLIPGPFAVVFSILMLGCLIATLLGVHALAGAIGLSGRRRLAAGLAVAISPLLIGHLVETRFDLLLAALVVWALWAAVTERWHLMWWLLAAAVLVKLTPLALIPALVIWQRHRGELRAALRGAVASVAAAALVILPFALLSPSGTWEMFSYHIDRPLQVESTGAAYLLGLHALADTGVTIENSFGSQGLSGDGPAIIAGISTAVMAVLLVAIFWTFWFGLRRARPLGDARLLLAASCAITVALLVGGKVLSPQFMIWLLPVAFLVAGRYGPAAFAIALAAIGLTLAYFPHSYWDLIDLQTLPIALLVLRDTALVALLAACWPRPSISDRPRGRTLGRPEVDPETAERAVSARFLVD